MAKTTLRNIRIDDELWDQAKAKAAEEGRDVSAATREWMSRWVQRPARKPRRKAAPPVAAAS